MGDNPSSEDGGETGTKPAVSTAAQAFSLVLDSLPIVGAVKSFVQMLAGKDAVTGEETSRAAEAGGILLGAVPGGKLLVKGEKAAEVGYDLVKATKEMASRADNAGHVLKLKNQLASQVQMAEAGTIMAGRGGRVAFRDAQRVASEHGGTAADWVKKTSSSFTDGKGTRFETHWVA